MITIKTINSDVDVFHDEELDVFMVRCGDNLLHYGDKSDSILRMLVDQRLTSILLPKHVIVDSFISKI